jgi:hypothetical protein
MSLFSSLLDFDLATDGLPKSVPTLGDVRTDQVQRVSNQSGPVCCSGSAGCSVTVGYFVGNSSDSSHKLRFEGSILSKRWLRDVSSFDFAIHRNNPKLVLMRLWIVLGKRLIDSSVSNYQQFDVWCNQLVPPNFAYFSARNCTAVVGTDDRCDAVPCQLMFDCRNHLKNQPGMPGKWLPSKRREMFSPFFISKAPGDEKCQ